MLVAADLGILGQGPNMRARRPCLKSACTRERAHFRDYHLLLDEQADQIFAMIDAIAERARKIDGRTLRSIADIARHQRLQDNDDELVEPTDRLLELMADNQRLTRRLRTTHGTCEEHDDVATASLIEVWIDETEHRTWFLSATQREPS